MPSDTAETDLIINWSLAIMEKSIYYRRSAQTIALGQNAARDTEILNEKTSFKSVPAKAESERRSSFEKLWDVYSSR